MGERIVSQVWAESEASCLPDIDTIVAEVKRHAQPGDTLAVLSNGGFGGIHGKLLAALG